MVDDDSQPPVPGSWQETLQSFTSGAGENADAARGLTLAFWGTIICVVGAPLALAGLVFSIRGLLRSGRLGGRKAAVTGIVGNTLVIALSVVEFALLVS